jgi:hypothetical protein
VDSICEKERWLVSRTPQRRTQVLNGSSSQVVPVVSTQTQALSALIPPQPGPAAALTSPRRRIPQWRPASLRPRLGIELPRGAFLPDVCWRSLIGARTSDISSGSAGGSSRTILKTRNARVGQPKLSAAHVQAAIDVFAWPFSCWCQAAASQLEWTR